MTRDRRADVPSRWRLRAQAARRRLLATPAAGLVAGAWRRRILVCLGDSHVWALEEVRARRLLPRTWLSVLGVGGATAFGLANPNSATNALEEFARALRTVPLRRPVFLLLGEVDAGFLAWLRAQQRGVPVQHELAESIRRYGVFLDGLIHAGRRRLIVATVPLPTVPDYTTWAGLGNARRAVTASLVERTQATRWYNTALRAAVRERGLALLDYEADLLDPDTGVVRADLVHPDPNDHHYDRAGFAAILARHLRAMGF